MPYCFTGFSQSFRGSPDKGNLILAVGFRGALANKHSHGGVRLRCARRVLSAFGYVARREEIKGLPRTPQNDCQRRDYKCNPDVSAVPAIFIKLPSELDCGRIGDLFLAATAFRAPICRVAVRAMNLAHCLKPFESQV